MTTLWVWPVSLVLLWADLPAVLQQINRPYPGRTQDVLTAGMIIVGVGDHHLFVRTRTIHVSMEIVGVMMMSEQLCCACINVLEIHKTLEYMAPWHCKCQKKQIKVKRSVQQLISHQCKCPVRTLKVSGRRIVYCRCE